MLEEALDKAERIQRYLVCGSCLIFYHVGAEAVHVDRVLYGRRDYTALLFGGKLEEEQEAAGFGLRRKRVQGKARVHQHGSA